MKLRRDLSGRALVKHLCSHWSYVQVHQSGSHIIVETEDPTHQRMAIPDHDTLRIGTLHNIVRAVSQHKGVSREQLLDEL